MRCAFLKPIGLLRIVGLAALLAQGGLLHAEQGSSEESATLQDQAQLAAVTDGASTLGGLALGAADANPLGFIAIVAKAPMLAAVKNMPQDEQADWNASFSAVWGGATANNLCVIAVILTSGAAAPFCPVVGVAWGVHEWRESAMERELWMICREERAYWHNPQMTCDFFKKPGGTALSATP